MVTFARHTHTHTQKKKCKITEAKQQKHVDSGCHTGGGREMRSGSSTWGGSSDQVKADGGSNRDPRFGGSIRNRLSPTPPHPTPPPPTPAFPFNVMAFPINVMTFPITGCSQLLGVPMPWRMAKWRWGRRKWRGAPIPGPPGPRHFLRPKRHLAMAWRRRQAWRHSINRERHSINWGRHNINWERHNINWERHNIKWKRRGGVGWGGGWG